MATTTATTTTLAPPARPPTERCITGTKIRPDSIRTLSIRPAAFPTTSAATDLIKTARPDLAASQPGASMPAIFLVHGAWHTPASYDPLVALLAARGYTTFRAHLPSSIGSTDAPTATLYDDAGIVRSQLQRIIERQGRDVVVVAHSYGAVVVTEAVKPEMTRESRRALGKQGGVLGLFLIAGYLVEQGASLARPEDGLPGWMHAKPDGRTLVPNPIPLFYSDVPTADAHALTAAVTGFSQRAAYTPTTRAAWRYVPLTYCLCAHDVAFPLERQQATVALARAAGVEVREVTMQAGHLPQLSVPGVVAVEVEEWIRVLADGV